MIVEARWTCPQGYELLKDEEMVRSIVANNHEFSVRIREDIQLEYGEPDDEGRVTIVGRVRILPAETEPRHRLHEHISDEDSAEIRINDHVMARMEREGDELWSVWMPIRHKDDTGERLSYRDRGSLREVLDRMSRRVSHITGLPS